MNLIPAQPGCPQTTTVNKIVVCCCFNFWLEMYWIILFTQYVYSWNYWCLNKLLVHVWIQKYLSWYCPSFDDVYVELVLCGNAAVQRRVHRCFSNEWTQCWVWCCFNENDSYQGRSVNSLIQFFDSLLLMDYLLLEWMSMTAVVYRWALSLTCYQWPLNVWTALCRNCKCTECGTSAFSRNWMYAENAHFSTVGSETETDTEIWWTSYVDEISMYTLL